jgi:lysophospholipase-3
MTFSLVPQSVRVKLLLPLVVLLFVIYKKWRARRFELLNTLKAHRCKPVLMIPGLGGSRLYDTAGALKWCSWQGFFPHMSNSWRDHLTVKYNPDTKQFEDEHNISAYRSLHWVDGVFRPTADFGGVQGVGNVLSTSVKSSWQFQGLIDMCMRHGYKTWDQGADTPSTLYGAPYDFRKITSPSEWIGYCKSLKALIEWIYQEQNHNVILLSHSMGSPLLLTFLVKYLPSVVPCAQAWKEKYIRRWVTVNGAFGGSGKALRSLLSGDSNGMGYICETGCHDWYQPMLENAAGVLWMLPSPLVFEDDNVPVLEVGECHFTAKEVLGFLEKVAPTAAQAYKDTVVPLLTLEPPGVSVVCVTSTQPKTPLQCCYKSESLHHTEVSMKDERLYYQKLQPNVQHMCGDGTVPYASLMVPQRWLGAQVQPVTFVRLNQENVAHSSILLEQESLKIIMSLIA